MIKRKKKERTNSVSSLLRSPACRRGESEAVTGFARQTIPVSLSAAFILSALLIHLSAGSRRRNANCTRRIISRACASVSGLNDALTKRAPTESA